MIRSRDSSPSSSDDDSPRTSRRLRFMGLARVARDVYIPKISDSVSQLASGVSSRAFVNDKYDAQGRIKVPSDAKIVLFPTYTRKGDDGKYHVDVGGWLSCPGLMTRKNRLIFSLVKQVIRYDSVVSKQAIDNLESDNLKQDIFNENSDTESVISEGSLASSTNSIGTKSGEDLLRERLAYFIARFIANAELTITVGSKNDMPTNELKSVDILTDGNGCFNLCIIVDYEPSVVQVVAKHDETVFEISDLNIVPDTGVAIISDIDDTVKLTGVIGDKRELLNSLFLNEVDKWKIPSVVKWYSSLFQSKKVTFHYVSNSPVQLFPTILQYLKTVNLPLGSIHLKQYTGNIISSLMEPSGSRKKTALTKLANDFPKKKFICIGDSGEYDFESYVDLAKNYPDKVIAIYIRYVPGSLSNIDEFKIFNELNRILQSRTITKKPNENEIIHNADELEDLIDLSDTTPVPVSIHSSTEKSKKLPPKVPEKPASLKVAPPIPNKPNSLKTGRPPPLPNRPSVAQPITKSHTESDLSNIHIHNKPLQPRPATTQVLDLDNPTKSELLDNLHNIYYSHHFEDLREIDERGANWIERVMGAVKALEHTNTTIRFFNDDEDDLISVSLEMLKDTDSNT